MKEIQIKSGESVRIVGSDNVEDRIFRGVVSLAKIAGFALLAFYLYRNHGQVFKFFKGLI